MQQQGFDHLREHLPPKFMRTLLDRFKAEGLQPYSSSTIANLQAARKYPRGEVVAGRHFLDRDQFIDFLNDKATATRPVGSSPEVLEKARRRSAEVRRGRKAGV